MSVKVDVSKESQQYIHSIIGVVLMFGIGLLPPIGALTPIGMDYLGILVGLIYLWSLVSIFWPSLLGLLALAICGQTTVALSPVTFGNYILIMTVFSFAIVFAISNTGVFDYLLRWLLNLKIAKGRPWVLNYILLVGLFFIFILGGGYAFLFIMWEIVYKLADIAGIPRRSKYCGAMVVGMMFANFLGGYTLAFKVGFLTPFGFLSAMTPIQPMNMLTTTMVLFICGFCAINIYFLLIKLVLRPDLSGMKNADVGSMSQDLPPMNRRQKVAGACLIVFIALMLLTGFTQFMGNSAIVQAYSRIGILGVCWLVAGMLAIIKVEGSPILILPDVAKMIPWDTICLIAIVFGMSNAMNQADTGIGAFLTTVLNPILGGRSTLMFYLILFTIILILTNFLNNAVVMIVSVTVIAAYLPTMTLNLQIMAILMMYMGNTAFLLPSSSMQGALIYTQAEQVSGKYIMLGAAFTIIAIFITMIAVIIPVADFFF